MCQQLLDLTWKPIKTRDRVNGGLPRALKVQKVLRIENPRLWDAYARKRQTIEALSASPQCIPTGPGQSGRSLTQKMMMEMPRSSVAFKSVAALSKHANEHYLFHGQSRPLMPLHD